MSLDNFLISEESPLRDALTQIEKNHRGFVLATGSVGAVSGMLTDGDLRRKLLEGMSLDDPVALCANRDFVWAPHDAPREQLLKKLDHNVRFIPLLDVNRRLAGVVSRDSLPLLEESPVYARARSPVRISFGGGGSDLTHYFAGEGGAVISATISLFSHATLRVREDEKILVHSLDLGGSLQADDLRLAVAQEGNFGLVQSVLKTIAPDFGFELYLYSDFPMNSGLGGSAVVSAAILGCFNQFKRDRWDLHEIAELAYQAERLYLGVAGGWQDQYATVFGGFNFMEFRMDQNIIHPLRIKPDVLLELEESLLLCDTGTTHDSGDIHQDQRQQMQQQNVRQQMQANVELGYQMRNHLLRGKLLKFGQSLHEAWMNKRQFSSKITSSRIDQIYEMAQRNGAVGGKILGAGGGGFFLFFVSPFRKHELMQCLEKDGLKIRPFGFEQGGLQAWTSRESLQTHGVEMQ